MRGGGAVRVAIGNARRRRGAASAAPGYGWLWRRFLYVAGAARRPRWRTRRIAALLGASTAAVSVTW